MTSRAISARPYERALSYSGTGGGSGVSSPSPAGGTKAPKEVPLHRYDYTQTPPTLATAAGSDAAAAASAAASAASSPEPVLLNTQTFHSTLEGKTSIVLFRSQATKRIRDVRAEIGGAFALMPPGLIDVFGKAWQIVPSLATS